MTHDPTSETLAPRGPWRVRSLRRRLVITALVWVVIAVPIGGFALAFAFREVVNNNFDERLTATLLLLIGSTEGTADGEVAVARPLTEQRFQEIYSGWYWVITHADQRLHSRSAWDLPLAPKAANISGVPRLRTTGDSLGNQLRIAEQTVAIPGVTAPVTFAVAGDLAGLQNEVRGFDRLLWLSLLALAAGLALAIVTQVTIGLRPLRRVADEVESVRAGRKQSLDEVGLHEIDRLVAQVNTLIDQDRRLVERARANAADLAHSLKTPLALLRTSFDDENDERLQHVRAIQRTIEWQFARAASTGPRQGVVTEVKAAAEALGAGMRKLHAARNLDIVIDVAADIRFAGDTEDLEEMLGNVLDNACKWTRSRVRLNAVRVNDKLRIEVTDDGPGMTAAQAAIASERGQRFDENTDGSGLGLAIVHDLAAIYGGSLQLGRSTSGGTLATIVLPAG
jgi:signal transduction histidine kinase